MALKFAANLSFCFLEHDNFLHRYQAAKNAGNKFSVHLFLHDIAVDFLFLSDMHVFKERCQKINNWLKKKDQLSGNRLLISFPLSSSFARSSLNCHRHFIFVPFFNPILLVFFIFS